MTIYPAPKINRPTINVSGKASVRPANKIENNTTDQALQRLLLHGTQTLNRVQKTQVTGSQNKAVPSETQSTFGVSTIASTAVQAAKKELQEKPMPAAPGHPTVSGASNKASLTKGGALGRLMLHDKLLMKPQEKPATSVHSKWATFVKAQPQDLPGFVRQITYVKGKIEEIKDMYRKELEQQPLTPIRDEVQILLITGTLKPVKGGYGGVYCLHDSKGEPKYIIKPADEAACALNNGKGHASPWYSDEIYSSVQNAELAYKCAELLDIQDITPKTEVMIIEHPAFHDILEGTIEGQDPSVQEMNKRFSPVKEKVCSVQPFVKGFWDLGTHLANQSTLEADELAKLCSENPNELEKLEDALKKMEKQEQLAMLCSKNLQAFKEKIEAVHTPVLDHKCCQKIAILNFTIGERDCNAGNFLCAKKPPLAGEDREVIKIDNSASFSKKNQPIVSGLRWFVHNYDVADKGIDLLKEKVLYLVHDESLIPDMDKFNQFKIKFKAYLEVIKKRKGEGAADSFVERVRALHHYALLFKEDNIQNLADLDYYMTEYLNQISK